MIFSYNKLKALAHVDVSVEQMAKAITSIGFEVEGFEKFSKVKGIKFGHVTKVYKNPQATKLNVCEIHFADQDRVIQTNATNVKQGDYLMAFVPGSSSGDIVFAPKEMQGIVSEGMLVSLHEIGYDATLAPEGKQDGIFTFDKVDLNLDPIQHFELDDYLIDVSVLTNRSDANSYLIMAREVAAYFNSKWDEPKFKQPTLMSTFEAQSNEDGVLTLVEATTKKVELSLQDTLFLIKSGIKIINPVVDLTNLTLLMTGVPTHAYDKQSLNSNLLYPGFYCGNFEMFGKKVVNLEYGYVILNADKVPVSLAGVMGAEATGVNSNTTEVIFEIGKFDVKDVRKTTKQIKVESNSSKQASKEVSLGSIELAHKFLSNYLHDFSAVINMPSITPKIIDFDLEYLNYMAGETILKTKQFFKAQTSLEILGFKFQDKKVYVPTYRHDINLKEDLVEEFFRFYGYDKFSPQQPSQKPFEKIYATKDYHQTLANCGYQQVWTYSLISNEKNIFNPFGFDKSISLETFVSKEREVIRDSLAISLAEVIDYNQKRKMENISIFDIGMVNQYAQVIALASTTKTFLELKTDLQNIYGETLEFKRTTQDIFHNGVSAHIYVQGKLVGWIGKIHPRLKISDAYFAEILLPKSKTSKIKFAEYDSSPLKYRDITIELGLKDSVAPVIAKYNQIIGVYEVEVIDVYQKDGKNHTTFRITLEDSAIATLEAKI